MLKTEDMERKVELGRFYFKEGNFPEASRLFGEVYSSYGNGNDAPPEILSSYGYSLAMGENGVDEGTLLCIRALKLEPDNPAFYLNLGRIYRKAGKKASAIKILRRGLMSDKRNKEIHFELERLGIRRRPIIPFLSRSHPLNRFLGKITSRLSKKGRGTRLDLNGNE